MSNGEVVLDSKIAALIVVLHRHGVVSASDVKAQMEEAFEHQKAEFHEELKASVLKLQMLVDALPPFVPQGRDRTPPG